MWQGYNLQALEAARAGQLFELGKPETKKDEEGNGCDTFQLLCTVSMDFQPSQGGHLVGRLAGFFLVERW